MDITEKNELLMKLMLVLVRDRRAMQGMIKNAGWIREYGRLPEDMGVYTLSRLTEEDIAALAKSIGIRKAPAHAKSDIFLNEAGYVLRTFSLHPTTLIRDASRMELEQVCGRIHLPINRLDELAGRPESYQEYKDVLFPLLEYYLFTGSEQGDSLFPADGLIDYTDPLNTNTWRSFDRAGALEYIWDHLMVSVQESSGEGWTMHIQVKRIETGEEV